MPTMSLRDEAPEGAPSPCETMVRRNHRQKPCAHVVICCIGESPSLSRSVSAPIPIPAGPRNVVGPTGHQSPWWVGSAYSRPRIGVRSCFRPVSFGRAGGPVTYRANLPGPPRLPRLRNRRRFSRTLERLRYPHAYRGPVTYREGLFVRTGDRHSAVLVSSRQYAGRAYVPICATCLDRFG